MLDVRAQASRSGTAGARRAAPRRKRATRRCSRCTTAPLSIRNRWPRPAPGTRAREGRRMLHEAAVPLPIPACLRAAETDPIRQGVAGEEGTCRYDADVQARSPVRCPPLLSAEWSPLVTARNRPGSPRWQVVAPGSALSGAVGLLLHNGGGVRRAWLALHWAIRRTSKMASRRSSAKPAGLGVIVRLGEIRGTSSAAGCRRSGIARPARLRPPGSQALST